ncbi:MAG: hypothetical protein Ct9H300mP18_05950 [Candidatus Neomarinimicrobiota bacterium]|nr:MAG: hypothetical protein Ct9H300mP18_05950 [Candidatus Neomarinimicrobiota bacterium]
MKKLKVSELKKMMDEKQTYFVRCREKNEVDYASINPHNIFLWENLNRFWN